MIEFENKILPIPLLPNIKPIYQIRKYKCQIIGCPHRAESSFDYEGETVAYIVCSNHFISIATGDWYAHIFLSSVVWTYNQFLDLLGVTFQ